jgi:WD40 repeat protein
MCERGRVLLLASVLILCPCLLPMADVVNRPRRSYGLGDLRAIALSPDGLWLASGGQSGAFLWELSDGQVRHRLEAHEVPVTALAFSPDSALLLTGARDGSVRLWSVEGGRELHSFHPHRREVSSLAWAPDGSMWVSASHDNYARVWSHPEGNLVRSLMSPGEFFNAALFTQDAARLITADTAITNNVALWELSSGDRIRSFGEHSGPVRKLVMLTDNRLATGGDDATVRIWNVATGERQQTLEGLTLIINGLAEGLSPDTLIGASLDGQAAGTATVAFSPDGTRVLTTIGFPQKAARIWLTETGELEREFLGHGDWLTAGAFSNDGTRIVTGADDRTVRLWNTESGALLRTFTGHLSGIRSVAISPDGTMVAGGGASFDPMARLWNVVSGQLTRLFEANAGAVTGLCFSPAGSELLVGWEDGLIRVFAIDSGEIVREIVVPAAFLNAAVFSPDGNYILTGESFPSFTARLWKTASGTLRRIFLGHTGSVNAVAFSPDGQWLLSGGDNVRLWDIRDLLGGLTVTRSGTDLEIIWNLGMLEQAEMVHGPWARLPEASSPWLAPPQGTARFYRVLVSESD